ncbi:MAG: pyridoxal-dependent decarboxylase, partial [Planctomycetota bacterium]
RDALAPERDALEHGNLPEEGVGDAAALEELWSLAEDRAAASPGPRFFHYVVGGATPAALGADWVSSALDQVASSASGSPLAVDLERVSTDWVAELVGLGEGSERFTGVLTSGATAANLVALGAARQWWGERHGVDVGEHGLASLPRPTVLASGRVHASVEKALAVLGLGRRSLVRCASANDGALDLDALRTACAALDGAPAIVVATAGCADAGAFDPLDAMADLCDAHDLWLHVDGAFGLFAGALPSERRLVDGVERARSVATDAHKWLNVPYDAGIAYVRERSFAAKTFRQRAAYLPPARDGARRLVPANLVPESSRRARALPLYAALRAWGARGFRAHFERCFALARDLARRVESAPDLQLVGRPESVVVPFRCAPSGYRKRDLDALNQEVAARVEAEGRVAVGTTRFRSVVCFRPAIVGWRTRERHVVELVDAVERALARTLAGGTATD